jgi:hypothetical protein
VRRIKFLDFLSKKTLTFGLFYSRKPQSFAYSAEEWTSYVQTNPEVYAVQESKMISAIELQRAMSLWTHLLPLIAEWGSKSNPWGPGVLLPTTSRPDYQRENGKSFPITPVHNTNNGVNVLDHTY